MRDFLLNEIELGDILVHIDGTKRRRKVYVFISLGSMTKGGSLRVEELWNGNWIKNNFPQHSVIKVSPDKLSELVHEYNGLFGPTKNTADDLAYQVESVLAKSQEIKNEI